MKRLHYTLSSLLLMSALLGGCATPGNQAAPEDPWERGNRGVYKFNDTLDRAVVKPAAKTYRNITPSWMRQGVSNFFTNLEQPVNIANDLLQAKPAAALTDTGRFVINTVFGIGGLFDWASDSEIPLNDEDFGQTLGKWGVPSGPYVMLPFIGPSTLRDAPSRYADYLLGPLRYADMHPAVEWGLRGLEVVDSRAGLLSTDNAIETANDPYAFIRNAWLQRREYLVRDGEGEEVEIYEETTDQTPAADPKGAAAPAATTNKP